MGRPVVHFEIIGTDAEKLRHYYGELFDWKFSADNPMNYGLTMREDNLSAEGIGLAGGVGAGPEGYPGHVTVYVEVPDVEAALAKAESLGGTRAMGPAKAMAGVEVGMFADPGGQPVRPVKSPSQRSGPAT